MPTYEYLCQACHHSFETWQKMIDEPLTTCSECGGHIRRVLYPAGIVFKGSGFYKTDHGNGSVAPGEHKKSESTDSASTEGKAEKSESKTSANDSSSSTTKSESKVPAESSTK